jgi:hypothetical protein
LIVVGVVGRGDMVVDNILDGVRNDILDGEEGNNMLVGVGSRLVGVDYNKWEHNVRRCFHLSCRRSPSSIHQA